MASLSRSETEILKLSETITVTLNRQVTPVNIMLLSDSVTISAERPKISEVTKLAETISVTLTTVKLSPTNTVELSEVITMDLVRSLSFDRVKLAESIDVVVTRVSYDVLQLSEQITIASDVVEGPQEKILFSESITVTQTYIEEPSDNLLYDEYPQFFLNKDAGGPDVLYLYDEVTIQLAKLDKLCMIESAVRAADSQRGENITVLYDEYPQFFLNKDGGGPEVLYLSEYIEVRLIHYSVLDLSETFVRSADFGRPQDNAILYDEYPQFYLSKQGTPNSIILSDVFYFEIPGYARTSFILSDEITVTHFRNLTEIKTEKVFLDETVTIEHEYVADLKETSYLNEYPQIAETKNLPYQHILTLSEDITVQIIHYSVLDLAETFVRAADSGRPQSESNYLNEYPQIAETKNLPYQHILTLSEFIEVRLIHYSVLDLAETFVRAADFGRPTSEIGYLNEYPQIAETKNLPYQHILTLSDRFYFEIPGYARTSFILSDEVTVTHFRNLTEVKTEKVFLDETIIIEKTYPVDQQEQEYLNEYPQTTHTRAPSYRHAIRLSEFIEVRLIHYSVLDLTETFIRAAKFSRPQEEDNILNEYPQTTHTKTPPYRHRLTLSEYIEVRLIHYSVLDLSETFVRSADFGRPQNELNYLNEYPQTTVNSAPAYRHAIALSEYMYATTANAYEGRTLKLSDELATFIDFSRTFNDGIELTETFTAYLTRVQENTEDAVLNEFPQYFFIN
jgi:hypothetical protein